MLFESSIRDDFMSAMLSFDYIASQALAFVTSGAAKTDPESIIVFSPKGDHYEVSTNTGAFRRSMTIRVNGTTDDGASAPLCAVRAKPLLSMTKKVEEDTTLSIQLYDDKVSISSGATSFNLVNLYESTMLVGSALSSTLDITLDADDIVPALGRAQNVGSGSDVVLSASKEDNTFSVTSGDEEMRSQEIYTASPGDDFTYIVPARNVKAINESLMKKVEISDIKVKSGQGFLEFVMTSAVGDSSALVDMTYSFPTVVGQSIHSDNPCDGDITSVFTAEKSILKSAIGYVSAATQGDSRVMLDATNGANYVTVKAEDADGSAQTTVINATIDTPRFVVAPASLLLNALKAVTGKEAVVGILDDESEDNWLSITPVFDESAEQESDNSDIIIAVQGCDEM